MFWETIDEILNTVLFVLIGLEVLVLTLLPRYVEAGFLAIPIVLLARFISVSIPVLLLRPFRSFSRHVIRILTWSGIRGGISVAMVLSLPLSPQRDLLLVVTYVVVIFSITGQGLTMGKLVRRSYRV
jgi:monovalent cation:H+ antiporter, CPA1 family